LTKRKRREAQRERSRRVNKHDSRRVTEQERKGLGVPTHLTALRKDPRGLQGQRKVWRERRTAAGSEFHFQHKKKKPKIGR